jgi:hypothetical protein
MGIKGLGDITINKTTLTSTVEHFERNVLTHNKISMDLHLIKQHPIEILYFENLCLIYGGFLMLFGLSMSKPFVITGLLVEFLFLNNIAINHDEKSLFNFSMLISIFGGVLSTK